MTITFLAPDGVAVTAMQERQARAVLRGGGSGRQLGGRSGFRVGTPSNALTATSTTWTLTPCAIGIDADAVAHQGVYDWATDANVTGAVTAADGTNPRKDIVYIQVNDSSAGDGTGVKTADVLYLAGTPGVTPSAPTLPARSFLVGTITVPQVGGGSPTVERNPAVCVAAGASLPVDLAARDALSKYDTLRVQRTDLPGRPDETWDATSATWAATTVMLARYAAIAIGGFSMTGDIFVEQMGTRKRVTVDVNVKRTGAGLSITDPWVAIGAIIPTAARGAGDLKYMAIAMTGGTNNNHATASINPADGILSVRSIGATFTWTTNAVVPLNLTYYI